MHGMAFLDNFGPRDFFVVVKVSTAIINLSAFFLNLNLIQG